MKPATLVTVTVGLALLHLLLLGYLGSRRNATATVVGDDANDAGGGAIDEDTDEPSLADARQDAVGTDSYVVRCRECRAANDRDYRYCRHCMAELPGGTPIQRSGTTRLGGVD